MSFSWEIEPVDPLAVLAKIAQTNQLHFYWENRRNDEAVVAYGTTKSFLCESRDRFLKSQQFIHDCLQQTISIGDLSLPWSGPHLFCSFTFFPQQNLDNNFPGSTIFLPRWQIARKKDKYVLVINLKLLDDRVKFQLSIDNIFQEIRTIISNKKAPKYSKKYLNNRIINHRSKQFKSAVTSALKAIQKKQYSKIVLAHALDVIAPIPFRLVDSLDNLRVNHPDCYIFSTSNGKGQNFIGASPERLISIENKLLITDALAGSAPRGKTPTEDVKIAKELLSSEKEKREHQAVSTFISQRLTQLGLKPQKSPLKLLQLANIQHLWTPIAAKLPPHIQPLDIVAQLHPTPAVAGVPTEIVCEEIKRYEMFDRALYAAPLGWINYQGNSTFIVGIRSALIEANHARLYAGAGIVAGSDPDKEFAEVTLKLQSLLNALV